MLNQLVVLVNLIGLFLVDTFLLADINITQNIPASMEPGSEVRVTVTIEKGDLTGFAKLQLDLPNGLTATAIETKGASFTFADQKAKFIWMALPSSPTFKISYTLSASKEASGLLPIQGRLSYIENNERRTYQLPVVKVDLGAPGMVATRSETKEGITEHDLVTAAGGAPATKPVVAVIDNVSGLPPAQGPGGVTVQRTVTPSSEQEMLVTVTIRKGDLRGFGKLQETIPAGFTAIEQTSEDAIFTAQDKIVKFVWLNLPIRNELRVVYRLRANQLPAGEYTIDGDFGYLLEEETQRVPIGQSKFFVGPKALDALAQDDQRMNEQDQKDVDLEIPQAPAKEKPAPAKPAREKEKPIAKKPAPRTTITGPEKGILY